MNADELRLLRRKETVAAISVGAWILCVLAAMVIAADGPSLLLGAAGWVFSAYWVALDRVCRHLREFWWTVFALVFGPVAVFLYLLSRPPAPTMCSGCGEELASASQACPACGRRSCLNALGRVYSDLADSLARGPVEQARKTVKYVTITLAAVVAAGLPFQYEHWTPLPWALCIAGYWVMLAWWVYLDATWRRMDATPWGVLTLLTNVFGLVTYLVIRYPDPRTCSRCGAYLAPELKRCPYCGAEAEPTCPRCQARVRADWVYCPSCAAQLPGPQAAAAPPAKPQPSATPVYSLRGTVCDAVTGSPISGAQVGIDSRVEPLAAETDAQGKFVLPDLQPRPYVLVASAPGYASDVRGCEPSASGVAQVHFSLHPLTCA